MHLRNHEKLKWNTKILLYGGFVLEPKFISANISTSTNAFKEIISGGTFAPEK